MSTVISRADGNFLTPASWGLVDTTSLSDSYVSSYAPGTSYIESENFIPGAITVDGMAVSFFSIGNSPSGTVSVRLRNVTDSTNAAEITVNQADIYPNDITPSAAPANRHWVFFSFGAVTLIAGKNYAIGIKVSTTTPGLNFATNTGSSTKWLRLLRTTTTQAPATGDKCVVAGGWTAAGTYGTRTITLDNTDVAYALAKLDISSGGELRSGVAASTAYALKMNGDISIGNKGTLTLGTPGGTAIPSTSSCIINMNCGSDLQYAIQVLPGGTLRSQGATKTNRTLLNANVAASQAIATVLDTTGWANGDSLVFAPTARTVGETEKMTVSTVDSSTQATMTGNFAYAHAGVSPTQGEVMNLTHNVKIYGASTSFRTKIVLYTNCITNMNYTEVRYVGSNAVGALNLYGSKSTQAVYKQFYYCSFYDGGGCFINEQQTSNSAYSDYLTIQYCNIYNFVGAGTSFMFGMGDNNSLYPPTDYSHITIDSNYFIYFTGQSGAYYYGGISLNNPEMIFTNNRIAAQTTGSTAAVAMGMKRALIRGNFANNVIHSCASTGLYLTGQVNSTGMWGWLTDWTIWRCAGVGINIQNSVSTQAQRMGPFYFHGLTLFGNTTYNLNYVGAASYYGITPIVIEDSNIQSDASYTTATGVYFGGQGFSPTRILLVNTNIGTTTQHTTTDIGGTMTTPIIEIVNGDLGATVSKWFDVYASRGDSGYVRFQKKAGAADDHRSYYSYGTIVSETSIRNTASGYSWKMAPNHASFKLMLPGPSIIDVFKSYVVSGTQVTVSVYLRKDSSYNGTNAPRLVLVGNRIAGISTDQTASLTAAADTWQQVTVSGTPSESGFIEFYIDCEGTAGNAYVDDINVTQP